MKKTRVDCAKCIEFEFPEYGEKSLIPISKAKCKLGKKVMFRVSGLHPFSVDWESGWFRYCDEFNDKMNEND